MDKSVAITMFPAWKNAGPSTADKPTIEKETRSKEDLDLPWQVVVHNDPVNLMSYVTMVFQRVFGYPREKAERHMLEVHHKGRSSVEVACASGLSFMCSNWLVSPARHTRKGWLIWKFADATMRSSSPSWIHFSPNFFGKSQRAQTQKVCQPLKNASLARQRIGKKRRFARNGNFMSNLSCGGSFRQQPKQWQRTWNS
jgi:ATP-dependent Clp protease adaptor protein ClpS